MLKAYGEPGCGVGLQHDGMFYWTPAQGGTEVDSLVQRGKECADIEVKAKEILSARDFKGLQASTELKAITGSSHLLNDACWSPRLLKHILRKAEQGVHGLDVLLGLGNPLPDQLDCLRRRSHTVPFLPALPGTGYGRRCLCTWRVPQG